MPVLSRRIRPVKNLKQGTLRSYGSDICEHLTPYRWKSIPAGLKAVAYVSEPGLLFNTWSIGCGECAPKDNYDWGRGSCQTFGCENSGGEEVPIFAYRKLGLFSSKRVRMLCETCKDKEISEETKIIISTSEIDEQLETNYQA